MSPGEEEQGGACVAHCMGAEAMARRTIVVSEFVPRPANPDTCEDADKLCERAVPFDPLSLLRVRYRTATSVAVALAVLALHALVLAPVFGSSRDGPVAPPQFGAPVGIEATIIDDRSASAISAPTLPRFTLRPIHVNLPDTRNHSTANPGLAALYGRYLGQIHARIDRAWLKPRSGIGAPVFRCKVEVLQRRDGSVRAITLQRCNGTTQWQQSLVQGISAASPLPAPPNPVVFARRVELHFEAVAHLPKARLRR